MLKTMLHKPRLLPIPRISMYLFIFGILSGIDARAQVIRGKIADSTQAPIPFVPVAILNSADSSLVKGSASNEKGEYSFERVKKGNYLIKAISPLYDDAYSQPFLFDSISDPEIPLIILRSKSVNLNEVSVIAVKPLVEFKEGMIVLNVEDSPLAAGNTAFDLLKRLPGIYVDAQNNIILNGKGGVKILLDGRIQRLNSQQIAALLMSMSADNISKMEVMTNPPVKYDAEGIGGMINIVTKKVKIVGFSGSIAGGISKGYTYRGGVDGSVNYKGKRFSAYSTLSWGDRPIYQDYIFDKTVTLNGNTTYLHEPGAMTDLQNYVSGKIGADFNLGKKTTAGFIASSGYNNNPHTDSGINVVSGYNDVGFSYYKYDMNENNKWIYPNYNVYLEQKLDTLGSTLNISADYVDYSQKRNIYSENLFKDDQGLEVLPRNVYKASHDSKVKVLAPKIDLKKNFRKAFSIEAGFKSNFTESTNNYTFSRMDTTGNLVKDTSVSNFYLYDETILAGYLNFKKEFKHSSLQLGARGENTAVDAINKTSNSRLIRNYFKLFPNVSFSYHKNPDHSFQLSFSSRIMRPNYTDLNPYRSYQDNYSSTIGNPNLLPQMMYQANFNYSIRNTFYNTLTYSYFDKPVIFLDLQNDTTKETVSQAKNFTGNNYYYGYMLYIQKQIKQWWNLSFNGQVFLNHFESEINGISFKRESIVYNFFFNNDIALPKNFKIQIMANYNGPNIFGINYNQPKWRLDIGFRKSLFKEKVNVVLNFADIFFTDVNRSWSRFNTQNTYFMNRSDTRRVQLNVSYKFGKVRVQKRDVMIEGSDRLKGK